MSAQNSTAERFRRVAGRFSECASAVPDADWDNPAPCEGWVARDVVRHLDDWIPGVLSRADLQPPARPSVDDDPAAAWACLVEWIQTLLDDPTTASREFDAGPPGRMTVENAIGMLVIGDIVIHTWDLARATGQNESLDQDIVSEMLIGMQSVDEQLRQSGQFGPKVTVPDDADDQTKLIAFTGRTP